ncbi:MAG TPA: hypothetical protein VKZ63_01310, partial [Kofleriaceae bacterium]|nr:hypothetical protein [Kofleriaceae bacterium]
DLTFELSGGAGALQISSDDPDVGSLGARIASGEIPELGVVAEEPVLVVSADLSWGAYQGLPIAAEVTYLLEVAAGGEVAGLAATSFHWDEEEGGGTRCDYEWEVSGQVTAP